MAFPGELTNAGLSGRPNKGRQEEEWRETLIPNFIPREIATPVSSWRLVFLSCIFLLAFFGLFLRLFHLQIVQGQENRELADSNRIQLRIIHAPRGVIFDRNGKVLAETNPGFRLGKQFISRDEALALEANNDPRFNDLEIDAIRYYPMGEQTAHILGYVGQISENELKLPQYSGYRVGDRVGRSGIEQIYEAELRGTDGAEVIEVDASGKKLRTLRTIDPIPGHNIYLSIDADLQKTVYDDLKQGVQRAKSCCGAAVVEDPNTGGILAMASYPSFDPNAFTDPKRNDEVSAYFNDPNSPLLNRVIAGTYPPGSTFKIATALAGLSSGKINSQTEFDDTGVMKLGPYSFANWYFTEYGKTEGWINMIRALQRSNDVYFYNVGEVIGEKKLGEVATEIGFGKKLGVDLPGEADGLIPTDEWKQASVGQVWYPGDTLHMAIGQGYVLATPLQIMGETSFVAANGKLYQPHLAIRITDPDGSGVKKFSFSPLVQNIFRQSDLGLVKQGLALVPSQGGTAWPFFNFSIPTAGKTGTAEFGDPKGATHAWYTSYAPAKSPQITATVLVEGAGEGSNIAAPIVKNIYSWYFSPDKNHVKNFDVAPVATASAKALGE